MSDNQPKSFMTVIDDIYAASLAAIDDNWTSQMKMEKEFYETRMKRLDTQRESDIVSLRRNFGYPDELKSAPESP